MNNNNLFFPRVFLIPMWEILKSKERPAYCIVEPGPQPGDFMVTCDLNKEVIRRIFDKEKVCIIEFQNGKPVSYCGTGKDVVTRIF